MKTVGELQARISDLSARVDGNLQAIKKRADVVAGDLVPAFTAGGAAYTAKSQDLDLYQQAYEELSQARDKLCRARELLCQVVVDDLTRSQLLDILDQADRATHRANAQQAPDT